MTNELRLSEIKEYFMAYTKAPESVVNTFFTFALKRLDQYETYNLKDLLYNYNQYVRLNPLAGNEFISEVFGKYHLGNGHALIRILKSIDSDDDPYKTFKIKKLQQEIKSIDNTIKDLVDSEYENGFGTTALKLLKTKNEHLKEIEHLKLSMETPI